MTAGCWGWGIICSLVLCSMGCPLRFPLVLWSLVSYKCDSLFFFLMGSFEPSDWRPINWCCVGDFSENSQGPEGLDTVHESLLRRRAGKECVSLCVCPVCVCVYLYMGVHVGPCMCMHVSGKGILSETHSGLCSHFSISYSHFRSGNLFLPWEIFFLRLFSSASSEATLSPSGALAWSLNKCAFLEPQMPGDSATTDARGTGPTLCLQGGRGESTMGWHQINVSEILFHYRNGKVKRDQLQGKTSMGAWRVMQVTNFNQGRPRAPLC